MLCCRWGGRPPSGIPLDKGTTNRHEPKVRALATALEERRSSAPTQRDSVDPLDRLPPQFGQQGVLQSLPAQQVRSLLA